MTPSNRRKEYKMTPFMAFMTWRRRQLEEQGVTFQGGWKDVAVAVDKEWITMDESIKEEWADRARNYVPPVTRPAPVKRKRSISPTPRSMSRPTPPWVSPVTPTPRSTSWTSPATPMATPPPPQSTPGPTPEPFQIINPFAIPVLPREKEVIGSPLCYYVKPATAERRTVNGGRGRGGYCRVRGGRLGSGPGSPDDWVDPETFFSIDAESALGPYGQMLKERGEREVCGVRVPSRREMDDWEWGDGDIKPAASAETVLAISQARMKEEEFAWGDGNPSILPNPVAMMTRPQPTATAFLPNPTFHRGMGRGIVKKEEEMGWGTERFNQQVKVNLGDDPEVEITGLRVRRGPTVERKIHPDDLANVKVKNEEEERVGEEKEQKFTPAEMSKVTEVTRAKVKNEEIAGEVINNFDNLPKVTQITGIKVESEKGLKEPVPEKKVNPGTFEKAPQSIGGKVKVKTEIEETPADETEQKFIPDVVEKATGEKVMVKTEEEGTFGEKPEQKFNPADEEKVTEIKKEKVIEVKKEKVTEVKIEKVTEIKKEKVTGVKVEVKTEMEETAGKEIEQKFIPTDVAKVTEVKKEKVSGVKVEVKTEEEEIAEEETEQSLNPGDFVQVKLELGATVEDEDENVHQRDAPEVNHKSDPSPGVKKQKRLDITYP